MSASLARPLIALALGAALATACSVKTHDDNGNETASISFGDGNAVTADAGGDADGNAADQTVAINIPGFSAKVQMPDLHLDGKDAKIDGIPLYPGTRLNGVNVNARQDDGDEGHGRVDMAFSASASPDELLDYYKSATRKGGWTERTPGAGQQFAATKPDDDGKTAHLVLSIAAAQKGSTGHFTIYSE